MSPLTKLKNSRLYNQIKHDWVFSDSAIRNFVKVCVVILAFILGTGNFLTVVRLIPVVVLIFIIALNIGRINMQRNVMEQQHIFIDELSANQKKPRSRKKKK